MPQELYQKLLTDIQHQNILGWDSSLRGFMSTFWEDIYINAHSLSHSRIENQWAQKLVETMLSLSSDIWKDRKQHLNGTTVVEAKQKLCECVQVKEVYKHLLRLQLSISNGGCPV